MPDDTKDTLITNQENTTVPHVEHARSFSQIYKIIFIVIVFFIILVISGMAIYLNSTPKIPAKENLVRIGLSLDSVKIQRWADERDVMIKKARTMNAIISVFSAESDDATQISQIENLISQKVSTIIIVAHDAAAVAPVIEKAQKAGIKVIDYDRLTSGGKPDLYLSFDSVKVGKYAAQYVIDAIPNNIPIPNIAYVGGSTTDNNSYLVREGAMNIIDPLVKTGKAKLVYNEFTKDWSPSEAFTNFKKFLASGGKVDGVVTAYDGLAYGVIQALGEKGLAGKVPVSGQNGELQAMQRIVQGTQTMSAYKPGKPLAEKAVEAAVAFAQGKKPETNAIINNKTADIASYLFDPIPVTKDTIKSTVIKDGTYSLEQIYGSTTPQQ
jgi:D-xylose transport system substrate-binding protein